jgi:hypothetical protein
LAVAFAGGDDDGTVTARVREATTGAPGWEVHLRQVLSWRTQAAGDAA